MSYLSEVLSTANERGIEEIRTNISSLSSNVHSCKSEVFTYLDNVYVTFLERPQKKKLLSQKINDLQEEITTLLNHAKQHTFQTLSEAQKDLKQRQSELCKLNTSIELISTIYQLHEYSQEIVSLKTAKKYVECMQKILETEQVLNTLNMNEHLSLLQELSLNIVTHKSMLIGTLTNLFKDNVVISPSENKSVLKIINSEIMLQDVLSALYFYKTSVAPLDKLTKFLWEYFFVPIVDNSVQVTTKLENNFAVVEIAVLDSKKQPYNVVFENLKVVLHFLAANFNIKLAENFCTLSYIGRDIRDNLSEIIIKHCLSDTIPSNSQQLEAYKVVVKETEDLEKTLVLCKIFSEDTTSILEYANNIDVLFINKKCQDYILRAQEMMKKDLHDMTEVGSKDDSLTSPNFELCCVSKSAIDLVNLLEMILKDTFNYSEVCAGRLFCAFQTICQNYTIVVPQHHKKLLQTIPQQIALFYNNCQYIAFKVTDWNPYFMKLRSALDINLSFVMKESQQVAQVGAEKFSEFVSAQIQQINETMQSSNFPKNTLEVVDAATEKCLRQCLRQQELLKTVWLKVLPYTLYNKTMGSMLDALITYLVNTIVKFEDISSSAAEHLVELLKMIQTRGGKLFTDPKEVTLFVESWYKLGELVFVLSGSLIDINDRWADGKGPLALQFQPEDLKQLVRALFQNTEKRAALLAKIY